MIKDKKSLWALFYENEAYSINGERIMGRQAAGNALLRAYANSDFDNIGVYARNQDTFNDFADNFSRLLPYEKKHQLSYIPWGNPKNLSSFGGLYFPAPDISKFVNQRYFYKDNSYSIIGVTHTTASEPAINSILSCYTSPLKPWDALICTSKSVKNSIDNLYDEYFNILKERIGATHKPSFEMPVIPLGVHLDDFNFSDDDKLISRKSLGIGSNDIAILFLGRLSFHAKAHFMPMYIALENVQRSLPKDIKLHLIQTGWFPNKVVEKMYRDESKLACPSIKCHFLDGRNINDKKLSYSSADIFISLVDNFQETFGLTPLEGMASGLPTIVSDWNGYKETVRNGVDGFRITTSTMSEGNGYDLALRHNLGIDTYDHYIGRASQTVSIDIQECIDKITLLCTNKELRLKMGKNAKERASEFSWNNIISMYLEFKNELDNKRTISISNNQTFLPPINIQDPYTFFNDYSTFKLTKDCIVITSNNNKIDLEDFYNFSSISYLENIAPNIEILKNIYNFIKKGKTLIISDIRNSLEYDNHVISKSILWLSKYGYIELKKPNEKK